MPITSPSDWIEYIAVLKLNDGREVSNYVPCRLRFTPMGFFEMDRDLQFKVLQSGVAHVEFMNGDFETLLNYGGDYVSFGNTVDLTRYRQ